MIVVLILLMLGAAWLVSAWSFMLMVGMTHHEILPAVIPISYQTSLQFAGISLLFAVGIGAIKGIVDSSAK